jgi:hypothetical protein
MRLVDGKNGGRDFIDLKPWIAYRHATQLLHSTHGSARPQLGIPSCAKRHDAESAMEMVNATFLFLNDRLIVTTLC